jgi:hydrogenase maturation factor
VLLLIPMCFSIPYKVLGIKNNIATVEGGKKIFIDESIKVNKGEYLRITGNIAVGKLTEKEGIKIRKIIKRLNNTI